MRTHEVEPTQILLVVFLGFIVLMTLWHIVR